MFFLFFILPFYVSISLILTLSSPHYISLGHVLSRVVDIQCYLLILPFFLRHWFLTFHLILRSLHQLADTHRHNVIVSNLSLTFRPIHSKVISKSVTEWTGNILHQPNKKRTKFFHAVRHLIISSIFSVGHL